MNIETKEIKKLKNTIWVLIAVLLVSVLVEICSLASVSLIMSDFGEGVEEALNEALEDELEEYYLKKEYDELEKLAKERISTHPNDEYSYYYLGLMYFQNEQYADAAKNLKIASKLDPNWNSARDYLDEACEQVEC